jgi:hypothetical protein
MQLLFSLSCQFWCRFLYGSQLFSSWLFWSWQFNGLKGHRPTNIRLLHRRLKIHCPKGYVHLQNPRKALLITWNHCSVLPIMSHFNFFRAVLMNVIHSQKCKMGANLLHKSWLLNGGLSRHFPTSSASSKTNVLCLSLSRWNGIWRAYWNSGARLSNWTVAAIAALLSCHTWSAMPK